METIEDSKTALETEAPGAATEAEATPSRTLGPSARRSLERAAVRDLKARKRSDYRQQNQADTARIDQLRRQRNEQVERIDRQDPRTRGRPTGCPRASIGFLGSTPSTRPWSPGVPPAGR